MYKEDIILKGEAKAFLQEMTSRIRKELKELAFREAAVEGVGQVSRDMLIDVAKMYFGTHP